MVFSDLRMGDWFEWDKRIYINLKDRIMSLNKDDFGTLYAPLYSEREVKYITVFDYDASAELEKFNKTKNLNADEVPYNMLLKSSSGNFYVKINPYIPGERDSNMVVVNTKGNFQGALVYSKYFTHQFDIIDKMRISLFEGKI